MNCNNNKQLAIENKWRQTRPQMIVWVKNFKTIDELKAKPMKGVRSVRTSTVLLNRKMTNSRINCEQTEWSGYWRKTKVKVHARIETWLPHQLKPINYLRSPCIFSTIYVIGRFMFKLALWKARLVFHFVWRSLIFDYERLIIFYWSSE